MDKPFCQATDRNKTFILDQLKVLFAEASSIFEIGSGTGQHAVYFGKNLKHLTWQTSDKEEKHDGIQQWIAQEKVSNVLSPILFDVNDSTIPIKVNGIFTANTFHILSFDEVKLSIDKSAGALLSNGLLVIYGPFNFNGQYTAPSNAVFDSQLKAQKPIMGIRDYEAIEAQCKKVGLLPTQVIPMPANNYLLIFKKT